jgi:hypothetical protein
MRSRRPLPVTVAATLLALLSLFGFPWPWMLLFPGGTTTNVRPLHGPCTGRSRPRSRSRIVDDESVELPGHHRCLCAQPSFGSTGGISGTNRRNTSS